MGNNRSGEIIVQLDKIIYRLNKNGTATIIGNTIDEIIDLELERQIEHDGIKYNVVEIKKRAFYENQYINSIIIPSSITKVGKSCFERASSLKYVDFVQMVALHEVKIEDKCFMDCIRLKYIHLPSGLKEISKMCFANCISLKEVSHSLRLEKIDVMAFWQAHKLSHFDFNPEITEINDSAFQSTNINYAEIGPNVKKVGQLCFAYIDNLRTMVIMNEEAEFGNHFMKNDQRITTYLKGSDKSDIIISLMKNIAEPHYFVTDEFNMVELNGVKYILFSKKVARLIGYNQYNLNENIVIPERIEGVPVVDFQPSSFKYVQCESCSFPKTIIRLKGKVFEGASVKKVIFNHKITIEEAKFVVSNDNVEIILNHS
jgi:hypothetical protein